MSVYVKRRIYIEASQKKSGTDLILRRGEKDVSFDAIDELSECGLRKIAIPIPTTDLDLLDGEQISLGKILYIETDTEVSIRFISISDTPISIKPIIAEESGLSYKPGALYMEGEFEHVYVSVSGASGTANLIVGIVGS